MRKDHWKYPRIFIFVALLMAGKSIVWGQPLSENLEMAWKNRRLQIKAENADLKQVLSRLAHTAHISIHYPASLQKKITLERSRISLEQALERLLKGTSYVVVYSGPNAKDARVNEVLVMETAGNRRKPGGPVENHLKKQIQSYLRQINALRLRLSKIDGNSNQGRQIQRNISRLEKTIQRIQGRM